MQYENPIDFIKLLKSEHRSIVATVHEIDIQQRGPSNLKSSVEKLNKITDLLFDHLEKEDKILYPTLLGSEDTSKIAKKYSYDMERLSCIALDFFKRYCINKAGLKIFIEDFINSYSLFKGLLKIRIQREETELYPAFILLQSGVLYSDVLSYVEEHEANNKRQKTIVLYGKNEPSLKALELGLEISGYKVVSTSSISRLESLAEIHGSDLILLEISKSSKDLNDLIIHLKEQAKQGAHLVGYTATDEGRLEEDLSNKFDLFISKPTLNIEDFSKKMKELLAR